TVEQRQYAETARSSGESLLGLLNDILDSSKIEAEKLHFESIDFALRAVVEESVQAMALRAAQKGLELVRGLGADLPTSVRGDPGRLRQVRLKLIGNAVK